MSTPGTELRVRDRKLEGTDKCFAAKTPLWQKVRRHLGVLQFALLIGSTSGIFLVMGALVSLWLWSKQGDPNSLRSRIVYNNWAKSVIAICCTIMQTCTAIQLGICCMMMPTLAFEKGCVLLCDAAQMSIHRFAANSPWSLAPPVFRGARVSGKFGILRLVAMLAVAMLLSQALTAVLLIDLYQDYVLGPRVVTQYLRHVEGLAFVSIQPLRIRPLSLARFGEERLGQPFSVSDSTGRRLNDTGTTLRGFPELRDNVERENLVYYHGAGAIAEGHVLCVSPDIDELIYVEPDRITGRLSSEFLFGSTNQPQAEGSFRWNGAQPSSDLVLDFNCTLGGYQGFMLCPLESPVVNNCPGFPTPCLLSSNTTWFLIIDEDTSLPWKELQERRQPPDLELARKLYNKDTYVFDGNGWASNTAYWSSGEDGGGRNYTTQMTLCAVANQHSMAMVEISSAWRADEPILGNPHALNASFTASLRRQLSESQDFTYRGVMNLQNFTIDEVKPFTPVVQNIRGGSSDYLLYLNRSRTAIQGDYTNSIMLVEELDEVYWMLFRETWENSSVSWALHSMFGTLVSEAFYDQLDIPQEVYEKARSSNSTGSLDTIRTMQSTKEAQVPTQKLGLFIACGILSFHMIVVATILRSYFSCKGEKFLGKPWRAVEQLHGVRQDRDDWEKPVEITETGIAVKIAANELPHGKWSHVPTFMS